MNRITALCVAAAVAATAATGAAAQPAAAATDGDKAVVLLLGAAALGLALHQSGKPPGPAAPATRADWKPGYGVPDGWAGGRWRNEDRDWPPRRRDRRGPIPSECVFEARVGGGIRDAVSPRCVDELTRIRVLPWACAFDIRTYYGRRTVYDAGCLSERGFWIEGVRRY